MFWKYNSATTSQLESILDKPDVTLTEVLDQEDIIQECKSQNKKLVEFLTKQENISQLLDLILQEPGEELEERVRFKFPNIASEVITCDVPQINEKLSSDHKLLDKLYGFLDTEAPLNPLLASFFSKTFGVLITRRPEQNWYSYSYTALQVINYFKTRAGFTDLMLRHVQTSAVMDLLLRLITCVDGSENKQSILDWLNEEKLIEKIIELFAEKPKLPVLPEAQETTEEEPMALEAEETPPDAPKEKTLQEILAEKDTHDNAGQLLVEIIRGSRDSMLSAGPAEKCNNTLLYSAESKHTVQMLLDAFLRPPLRERVVVNCVSVLLVLLEVRRPMPQGQGAYTDHQDNAPNNADIERQERVVEDTVETIIPRLPEIVDILINPPYKPPVHTTAGVLDPPLGATRIAVCLLISALLETHNTAVNPTLAATPFLNSILELFFKYSLNNFIHSLTESCLRSILFWHKPSVDLNTTAENADKPAESDTLQTPKVTLETENPLEGVVPEPELLENPLLVQLFTEARFLDRLIGAWEATVDHRVAYMGHVTLLSNHVQEVRGEGGTVVNNNNRILFNQLFDKLPEEARNKWAEIAGSKLAETNKRNEITLTRENKRNPSSDDDSDFRDIQFPQDTALQQMYSDYQMQFISENFVETFGFNEDDFNDTEDGIGRSIGKLTPAVNFLMNTDDNTKKAIFESICENRPNKGFVDSDEEDEVWSERTTELTFAGRITPDPSKERGVEAGEHSSEEEDGEESKMEVDVDPWSAVDPPASAPVAMDTSAPWGENKSATDEGWANFEQPKAESGGDNWADFSTLSSAGGEGFTSFSKFPETSAKQEEWSPAMSSSPEATMLDEMMRRRSEEREGGAQTSSPSPRREAFRPESPDIANTDANQAPVPSDIIADPSEQGPTPTDQEPTPSEQGPTPTEQGPTPSEEGPTPTEQGPTPSEQGPTPSEQGPTPSEQGPTPSEQGPTVSEQEPVSIQIAADEGTVTIEKSIEDSPLVAEEPTPVATEEGPTQNEVNQSQTTTSVETAATVQEA